MSGKTGFRGALAECWRVPKKITTEAQRSRRGGATLPPCPLCLCGSNNLEKNVILFGPRRIAIRCGEALRRAGAARRRGVVTQSAACIIWENLWPVMLKG